MSCDPSDPTTYPLFRVLDASTGQVTDPGHLEMVIQDPPANRLHIFTGTAIIDFRPTDDGVQRNGTVRVLLNYPPLVNPSQFVDAACTASLSSLFSLDEDVGTTWAVNCVMAEPWQPPGRSQFRLTLVATVAIAGAGGNTGLSRFGYQANVKMRLG
jgi:hypothetical protein